MRFSLPRIRHDYTSFEALSRLYAQTKEMIFDNVEIDMRATNWFDADMCAVFGAILHSLRTRLNEVNLIHIPLSVEEILSKTAFSVIMVARKFRIGGEQLLHTRGLMLKTITISRTILKMS